MTNYTAGRWAGGFLLGRLYLEGGELMPGPAVLFRQIHRLRRFARDLQEQIDRIPSRLKARKNKVTREEDAARDNQEAIKQLKKRIHEKEVTRNPLGPLQSIGEGVGSALAR